MTLLDRVEASKTLKVLSKPPLRFGVEHEKEFFIFTKVDRVVPCGLKIAHGAGGVVSTAVADAGEQEAGGQAS